ncbi:hypothetical protein A9Q91_05265 [Candidatus Gracilibacteria bacterium 28_42_T64]|nr:hypothetical protein A9Q91_05265 [Candidatus Gracilibacteria bacterium 28_42_T64]
MKHSLSLKEQIQEIIALLQHDFFQGQGILLDNRLLPVLVSKRLTDILHIDLSSIKIYIPISIGCDLGAFYPSKKHGLLQCQYEKLLNKSFEIDIFICSQKHYNELKNEHIMVEGLPLSLDFEKEYSFQKIRDNDYVLGSAEIINMINCDVSDIQENYNFYTSEYLKYISIVKNLQQKTFKYQSILEKYFFRFQAVKFKRAIQFYQEILNMGYSSIEQYFDSQKTQRRSISYDINISIQQDSYEGKVHKVYNVESASDLNKGSIMVAENTNPEFLRAFYNAQCICVETRSELSHAAITCRELGIPLMLGAEGIFFSCQNDDTLEINTVSKKINIK